MESGVLSEVFLPLAIVLIMIAIMLRFVDIRKEL